MLTVDSESGGTRTLVPFIPACGSVMFMWNGDWVPADPAEPGPGGSRRRRSDRDPNHLTPPPDGSGSVTKTLIVSEAGVDGYSTPNQAPSMPPCQGRPPVD